MIKFTPNINNTYCTEYKGCSVEVGGNKSYILIQNDADYDFLATNGLHEFELTTESGVTDNWSGAEWDALIEAIEEIPDDGASENEG
jgi:hypothetical protein